MIPRNIRPLLGLLTLLGPLLSPLSGLGADAAPKPSAPTPRAAVTLPAFLNLNGHPQAPGAEIPTGYVGSDSCLDCHPSEHASWHRSFHRTMTQRMDPSTVLGPFDGTEIESGGYRYRLTREGDRFLSEGPDPDLLMYWVQGRKTNPPPNLPRVQLPVVMATGSHHYQTYWVPSPRHPGILQTLPLVYLRETRQWAPREAAFVHGPDDPERFVTQWNHHCIQCHSTGGNPGLDKPSGQLRTQVAELGISCESCHGPGGAHVELRRSLPKGEKPVTERIINPADLSPERSSEVCGQCHGVFLHKDDFAFDFAQNGILYRPGEVLERTRILPPVSTGGIAGIGLGGSPPEPSILPEPLVARRADARRRTGVLCATGNRVPCPGRDVVPDLPLHAFQRSGRPAPTRSEPRGLMPRMPS